MYPFVTQFETRRWQVEDWIAAREASRAVRESSRPVLTQLPRRERTALNRFTHALDVPSGERVLSQGNDPDSFFLIERGRLAVIRDAVHAADLGPGDFFGEIALLQRRPRTASVIATTDVRVRVISQRDFVTAVRILPTFARVLQDAARTRLSPATS